MKVTVCFQDIRVVVPCVFERPFVKHLIQDSLIRYNKLIAKPTDESWLNKVNVKLVLNDGGILDPDDRIADVVDDKEQLTAIFEAKEEHDRTSLQPHQGDGMSDSSIPDASTSAATAAAAYTVDLNSTNAKLNTITMKRNPFEIESPNLFNKYEVNSLKIKQAKIAPITNSFNSKYEVVVTEKDLNKKVKLHVRRSSNSDIKLKSSDVLQTNSGFVKSENKKHDLFPTDRYKIFIIKFVKSAEPLGINVTQYIDEKDRNDGLLIHSIEKNSRVDRDGRLLKYDRILSINGQDLKDHDFTESQLIFRSAMKEKEIVLEICRVTGGGDFYFDQQPTLQHKLEESIDRIKSEKLIVEEKKLINGDELIIGEDEMDTGSWERLEITLKKSSKGLGFLLTTYEKVPGIEINPTYIKDIMPNTPAYVDGRLKKGDIIEKVNDIPVENHNYIISVLSSVKIDETVKLTILRLFYNNPEFLQSPDVLTQDRLTSSNSLKVGSQNSLPHSQISSSTSSLKYNANQNSNMFSEQQFRSMVDLRDIDNQIQDEEESKTFRRFISEGDISSINAQKNTEIMYESVKHLDGEGGIEGDVPQRRPKVTRNADMNDSFRSAVDRSFDSRKLAFKDEDVIISKIENPTNNSKKQTGKKFGWIFRRNKKYKDKSKIVKKDQACQITSAEVSPVITLPSSSPVSVSMEEKSPIIFSLKAQSLPPPPPLASSIYSVDQSNKRNNQPLYSIVQKRKVQIKNDPQIKKNLNESKKSLKLVRQSLNSDIPGMDDQPDSSQMKDSDFPNLKIDVRDNNKRIVDSLERRGEEIGANFRLPKRDYRSNVDDHFYVNVSSISPVNRNINLPYAEDYRENNHRINLNSVNGQMGYAPSRP